MTATTNTPTELLCVQVYPEDDQAYVLLLDYSEVKNRTNTAHKKHDSTWSLLVANKIAAAIKSKEKCEEIDWDSLDYLEKCSGKLPGQILKQPITLYTI